MIIYESLYNYYGPQNWWPGEGIEIAVGAVLTQQTNWVNVEKAIKNLKKANCLDLNCLKTVSIDKLATLIKPSGYYRIKAQRLKNLVDLLSLDLHPSRDKLLAVKGLGYETVDSILLYWFEELFFIIDSYTFRILDRMGLYKKKNYMELQKIFMNNIPRDLQLYKEFHALLVKHAKSCCTKNLPSCNACPIRSDCYYFLKNN